MASKFQPALFLLLFSLTLVAAAEQPLELAQRSYDHNRVSDSVAEITMILTGKSGTERVRRLTSTTKLNSAGENMRLLEFTHPADIKGMTTLLIEQVARDDDMWTYLPALKKVRRLLAQNKRDSFAGSNLTFGDILGHKPDDWTFRLEGPQKLDAVPVTVLEAVPRTPAIAAQTGYSKRRLWLANDTAVALRTEYFDESGTLFKTISVSDVRVVDVARRKTQYMRIDAVDHLSGQRTTMIFDKFSANVGLRESDFSPEALNP